MENSTTMVKKGETYNIEIEDIGSNGEGIGRINNLTVFVENGVPGDILSIIIDVVKKKYATARLIEIVKASEKRVKPTCLIVNECGGCQLQHISYGGQLELKTNMVKAAIQRIGKLTDVIIHDTIGMDNPTQYRNKAQFPVSVVKGKAIIGFYKKGTHEIVDTPTCEIQHEINEKIIRIIREYMNNNRVSAYDEKTGRGLIRHIVTKTGYTSGEIMVVLVTNGRDLPEKEKLLNQLTKEIPKVNIIQNINTKKGNRIMGYESITLFGKDKIIDYIGKLKFEISPLSFFQVNPTQTKVLYHKTLEYASLTGKENVYDIYCGIGTISLFLAQKAKKVYGVEVVEQAIEDAKRNSQINNIDNTEFYVGEAEVVVPKLYKQGITADVVVVDPPRKGCDEKVLDTIVKINPERIVYVSCNPATLARDLRYLDDRGYKTVEVQPVDMFPHTSHVECVVKLYKK